LPLFDVRHSTPQGGGFRRLARYGIEARRLFEEHDVDLVVTDIRMPKLDGAALVAEISRSSRPVPCIVMTAFGTPELELTLERMGIIELIDKPLDIGELRKRILDGLDERSGDSLLRGLSVASFLQLLALEHKTCTVRIKQEGDSGMLFFRDGELYDASLGEQTGLEACKKMTITTPKGLVVMECSGVDSASHLHFIVALAADGNQALARKTLEKIVPKVVEEMS